VTPPARFLRLLCIGLVALVSGCDKLASGFTRAADAATPSRNFSLHDAPRTLPAIVFQDGQGRAVRLSDFRGKVVVLNLWATWCAPCREEMPTLDRLQGRLGGADFAVVALSVDFTGVQSVHDFYRQIGIKNLRVYIEPTSQVLDQLKVIGLPATLLLDRRGREIGRLLGSTRWDSPEMLKFLRGVIEPDRDDRTVQAGDRLLPVKTK
jgi:thiol-disulfide isomerase/thioredoxin